MDIGMLRHRHAPSPSHTHHSQAHRARNLHNIHCHIGNNWNNTRERRHGMCCSSILRYNIIESKTKKAEGHGHGRVCLDMDWTRSTNVRR